MKLIKICGITRPRDARLAADLGADLLGLNFVKESPRCLDVERALAVANEVRGQLKLVGVFVNQPAHEVERIAAAVDLDLLQFHGDEDSEYVRPFGRRAIKAFRVGQDFSAEELTSYEGVWGYLFDALHPTLFGGTGRQWPYEAIAHLSTTRPVLVAGGIGPETACDALLRSGASGIDVCSGLESSLGVKDPPMMRKLFSEIRETGNHG
jgi:phosphoribosylanthranilate isomerase